MAYEISNGKSRSDGIRGKDFNQPNFPAGEDRGRESLDWSTDILDDPADKDSITDPTVGWDNGYGIRSKG